MSYILQDDELQGHLNSAFVNTMVALVKEKYITQKQCDDLCSNYSIIIENTRWLPKCVSKWIGLDDSHVNYRLVKVINRVEAKDETT